MVFKYNGSGRDGPAPLRKLLGYIVRVNHDVASHWHKCADLIPLANTACGFDKNDATMIPVDLAMIQFALEFETAAGDACILLSP